MSVLTVDQILDCAHANVCMACGNTGVSPTHRETCTACLERWCTRAGCNLPLYGLDAEDLVCLELAVDGSEQHCMPSEPLPPDIEYTNALRTALH